MSRSFLIVLLLLAGGCDIARSGTSNGQASTTIAQAAQPAVQPTPESVEEPAPRAPRSLDELLPETFELLVMPWRGDLDGMIERRFIRVLVVSGSPQFFYYKGKPRGVVSELLALFQRELNASLGRRLDQVEVVPMPVSRDHLIPALLTGQADLVAADLTITDARSGIVDFSVPFATGVDEVVVFHPLGKEQIRSIAGIQLEYLRKRLKDRHMDIDIDEKALDKLGEAGFDPVYGARPLKRAIQQQLENPLAQDILGGKFITGDVIEVSVDGDKLSFRKSSRKAAAA